MNCTFIIGHGYVEESRNTYAIVNYHSDTDDSIQTITNFIQELRKTAPREIIRDFLSDFWHYSSCEMGCENIFDEIYDMDWWGTVVEGQCFRLCGFDHFFDDPKEDSHHLSRCDFEVIGVGDLKREQIEQIYEEVYGEKDKQVEEEPEPTESDRMFPDSMKMTYSVSTKNGFYEVAMKAPNGMVVHLDKTFSLLDDGPEEIDFWVKRNVAKDSTRI